MCDLPLALVPVPTAAIAVGERPSPRRSLIFYGLGGVGLAMIALFPATVPVVSLGALATCAISAFVLSMRGSCTCDQVACAVEPRSIVSCELREIYRTVLFAFSELDRTVAEAPRLHTHVAPVLERCRAAVTTCGRMAHLADPLQQYLDSHDPDHMRWELDRLRACTETTRDEVATAALARAVSARARQLASRDQIAGQRDRVHAHLELVRASIEAFTATIVKVRGTDEEQLVRAGESTLEQLDEIDDELATLESALETELAA